MKILKWRYLVCWTVVLTVSSAETSRVTAAQANPIGLSGFNADVVTENAATPFAERFDNQTNGASWFEAGARDSGGTTHADGLVSGGAFASAAVNSVTGGNTNFQLQPYTGNNTLKLGDEDATTNNLNFLSPQKYHSLAILAASGSSVANATGTLTIKFTDGTTSAALSYNASDWWTGVTGTSQPEAFNNVGRNADIGATGNSFTYEGPIGGFGFGMYETDINLDALGLSNRAIQSITFTQANNSFITGVFAISGDPVTPEPASGTLIASGLLALGAYWRWPRGKRA